MERLVLVGHGIKSGCWGGCSLIIVYRMFLCFTSVGLVLRWFKVIEGRRGLTVVS